jgi:hypothetical protein
MSEAEYYVYRAALQAVRRIQFYLYKRRCIASFEWHRSAEYRIPLKAAFTRIMDRPRISPEGIDNVRAHLPFNGRFFPFFLLLPANVFRYVHFARRECDIRV